VFLKQSNDPIPVVVLANKVRNYNGTFLSISKPSEKVVLIFFQVRYKSGRILCRGTTENG